MCEIFAVCSRYPARVILSLAEFAKHGGLVGPHVDGWGFTFFDGAEAVVFKEPVAAWDSPWLRLVEREGIGSTLLMFHIRQATLGPRSLANTQPFVRELAGRKHVFAHNGHLGELDGHPLFPLEGFRPVGQTDSEHAFCSLLGELREAWSTSSGTPSVARRLAAIQRFVERTRTLGPSNFVYSDGDALFVHGDRRRRSGQTEPRPPGLYALWRNFVTEGGALVAGGLRLEDSHPDQRSVLIASVPLTREGWIPLPSGRVLAFRGGELAPVSESSSSVA